LSAALLVTIFFVKIPFFLLRNFWNHGILLHLLQKGCPIGRTYNQIAKRTVVDELRRQSS
jgi:hypothetical protein